MSDMAVKPGFFVTGTDTEVGKTLIAAALIHRLKDHYSVVAGFKPVVAGMNMIDGVLQNEDLMALSRAMNYPHQKDYSDICPYQLKVPAAPHLVAKQEKMSLSYEHMIDSFSQLANKVDAVVVEGVGGFKVPLIESHPSSHRANSADFAKEIRLPVILVVGMRLGCINHALLTIEAIQSRGLSLAGWVANTVGPMQFLEENIATLQELISAPLLGVVPQLSETLMAVPYSCEAIQTAARHIRLPKEL
jgi:dethiobiotin synthetase